MRSVELDVASNWNLRVYRQTLASVNPPTYQVYKAMESALKAQQLTMARNPNIADNFFTPPLVIFDRGNFNDPRHPSVEALSERSEEVADRLAGVLDLEIDNTAVSRRAGLPFIRSVGGITLFGATYSAEVFADAQTRVVRALEAMAGEPLDIHGHIPYVRLGAVEGSDQATRSSIEAVWEEIAPQLSVIPPVNFGEVTIDYARPGSTEDTPASQQWVRNLSVVR